MIKYEQTNQLAVSLNVNQCDFVSIYDYSGIKIKSLSPESIKTETREKQNLLKVNYPNLSDSFASALILWCKSKNKTQEWLTDATMYVLEHCKAFPTIAHFAEFDRIGIRSEMTVLYICKATGRRKDEFYRCLSPNGELIWWDSSNGELPKGFRKIEREKINQDIQPDVRMSPEVAKSVFSKMKEDLGLKYFVNPLKKETTSLEEYLKQFSIYPYSDIDILIRENDSWKKKVIQNKTFVIMKKYSDVELERIIGEYVS